MHELEIISKTLCDNNIELSHNQLQQLLTYYELVTKYNKVFNITTITDIVDFSCKHFADSLLNYQYYTKNSSVCDIGTGGGFPGIPLKIARPDLEIVLVDSLSKRVNFLNSVINELDLKNIIAIHSRAQELTLHNVSRETFDYTVSRAVSRLNVLCEYCLPFLKNNGEMLAFKALDIENELKQAEQAILILGGDAPQVFDYILKDLNNNHFERNIVSIKKIKQTPSKYPRLKDKILKQPL